jgi:hypothetical protein
MKRVGGWLSAKTPLQSSSSTRSLTALDEPHACKIRLHVIKRQLLTETSERGSSSSSSYSKWCLYRLDLAFKKSPLTFAPDDVDLAEAELAKGTSPFHKVRLESSGLDLLNLWTNRNTK